MKKKMYGKMVNTKEKNRFGGNANIFINWQQSIFCKSESLGSQKALVKKRHKQGAKTAGLPTFNDGMKDCFRNQSACPEPQFTRVGPGHSPGLRAEPNRGPAAQEAGARARSTEREEAQGPRAVLP